MTLTGNKGEWSELYAFFKLLADGKLYSGDGHLRIYEDEFYPILKIFRNDAPKRVEYSIDASRHKILVVGKQRAVDLSQQEVGEQAQLLLDLIRGMKARTAAFPETEDFMRKMACETIKAKSTDKADIRIVIHNLRTGTKPELGYSIKSRLGANSSLVNSCEDGTNFIYEIKGFPYTRIDEFNALKLFRHKFNLLRTAGASVSFVRIASDILYNNLLMLDSCMPKLISECLLRYYSGEEKCLHKLEKLLREENPLHFDIERQPLYYEYKLKQFLLAFALGMTAATLWNGKFNANGGSIVVKETGEIVCFHFFDRNDFEDFLFNNTYFDTPSTKRHHFGNLYEQDGKLYLKLNLLVKYC